jgi:REP element-mobilizing transposase RayT
MAHSFTKLLYHCTFSTKGRRQMLKARVADRVDAYIAGIARKHGAHLIRIGGVPDHRHLLLELKPTVNVADLMRLVKANSSKWLRETFPQMVGFAWQTGYAAFTVSVSARSRLVGYIDGQQEHHRRMSFEEELRALLDRHGIEYDPAHLLD